MGEGLGGVVCTVAFFGPPIGVGWLISICERRTSIKEIMAFTAFCGLVVFAWTTLVEMVASI